MSSSRKYDTNGERQAAYRVRQAAARQQELADRGLPSFPSLPTLPGTARWKGAIQRCVVLLTLVCTEMTAYYDARSETWQDGERGEAHQEQIDALNDLLTTLEELGS
jgi:hypothetical protein